MLLVIIAQPVLTSWTVLLPTHAMNAQVLMVHKRPTQVDHSICVTRVFAYERTDVHNDNIWVLLSAAFVERDDDKDVFET